MIVWDGAIGHFAPEATVELLAQDRQAPSLRTGSSAAPSRLGAEGIDHLQFFSGLDQLRGCSRLTFPHLWLREVGYRHRRALPARGVLARVRDPCSAGGRSWQSLGGRLMRGRASRAAGLARRALRAPDAIAEVQAQIGGLQSRWVAELGADEIERAEFRVFSQFGEDGIIQFLVQRVPIERPRLRRVRRRGLRRVEHALPARQRRLARADRRRRHGASALPRGQPAAWRTTIDAVTAFIDRENVNDVIGRGGHGARSACSRSTSTGTTTGSSRRSTVVSPQILVAEYNSLFGPERAVTVPYDSAFARGREALLAPLLGRLARGADAGRRKKGFALVGGNRAGNNAFFVRRDALGDIPERTVASAGARRSSASRAARAAS